MTKSTSTMSVSPQQSQPGNDSNDNDLLLIRNNEDTTTEQRGSHCLTDTESEAETSRGGEASQLPHSTLSHPRITTDATKQEVWRLDEGSGSLGERRATADSLSARPRQDSAVPKAVTRSSSLREQRRPSFQNIYCRSSSKTRPPSPDPKDSHKSQRHPQNGHSPLWRTRSDGPLVNQRANRSPVSPRRSSSIKTWEKPTISGLLQLPHSRHHEEFSTAQDMLISTGVASPARTRRSSSIKLAGNMPPFPVRRTSNVRPHDHSHPDTAHRVPSIWSLSDRLQTTAIGTDLTSDVETHSTRDIADTINEHISDSDDDFNPATDLSSYDHRHLSNSQSPATKSSPTSELPTVTVTIPTQVYYPPYRRLERLNQNASTGRRRKMAVAGSPVESLSFDFSDLGKQNKNASGSETGDCSGHLQEVKNLAVRLNLDARRPSVFAWRSQLGDLFSRRSCSRDVSLEEAEHRPLDARWLHIGEALQKLRSDLLSMQQLDQELARTLIALRQDIHTVKLQMSYARHREDLEEAIDIEEERDDLGELCDDLPDQFSPALRNCGVTRMNIHSRRFSVF